jgi:hypothetical protein
VTRLYRNPVAGVTWIERGPGTPLIVISDHGSGVDFQWGTPDANSLIYDDELHAVETEQLDAAVSAERARIRNAVAGSDIAATAKSTVRKIIGGE